MSASAPYLISKFVDPAFAFFIGSTAAALRIRREEKEKYPDQPNDWPSLAQKAVRLTTDYYNGYEKSSNPAKQ